MIIVAHNIRSMHNVGSIFRNAAAFNVEKLYLTGITSTPPRKEIAKVALGAEELVDWESGDILNIIEKLKSDGYKVYGLETGEDTISINDLVDSPPAGGGVRGGGRKRIALVLGNEVEGIDKEAISQLDGLVEIPMGKKRSLNVSVASGIAMFMIQ